MGVGLEGVPRRLPAPKHKWPASDPTPAAENCTLQRGSTGSRNLLALPLLKSKVSGEGSFAHSHPTARRLRSSAQKGWQKKKRVILGPREEAQVRSCQRPLRRHKGPAGG